MSAFLVAKRQLRGDLRLSTVKPLNVQTRWSLNDPLPTPTRRIAAIPDRVDRLENKAK